MNLTLHHKLAFLLATLNAFDAASTLICVNTGLATEANPIMGWLLGLGPLPFPTAKFLMVGFGLWVLGFKQTPLTLAALGLSCVAYSAIAYVHISHLLV